MITKKNGNNIIDMYFAFPLHTTMTTEIFSQFSYPPPKSIINMHAM